MRINVMLNEELDIRIFSFPMRYQPTDLPDRSHIGPRWNSYFLRSFQIMLQATHGVVSGAPEFFRTAYGDTYEDFKKLLRRPHHFIFNRFWYEQYGGKAEFTEYETKFGKLSSEDQDELMNFLSTHDQDDYENHADELTNIATRKVLPFYIPLLKDEEQKIWNASRKLRKADNTLNLVPEDELVEDAGLNDAGYTPEQVQNSKKPKPSRKLVA
jgi:hypothetical protein